MNAGAGMTDTVQPPQDAKPGPQGLGGWMILPTIVTMLSPVQIILSLLYEFLTMTASGLWTRAPQALKNFLAGEIAFSILMALGWIYCVGLLFKKSRRFPAFFIGMFLATFAFNGVDALISALVFGAKLTSADLKGVIGSAVGCLIWIPYMIVSRRVGNTFVN